MECEEFNLKDAVMENKLDDFEFSEQHIIIILYNILCALNFLHTANVIHRDIKPSNILIDDECGVKFCDFGLSRTCVEGKSDMNSLAYIKFEDYK